MRYKALTISREFGSGGAEIAGIVARRLGWKLVDEKLLTEISQRTQAPVSAVASLDERLDPWLYRILHHSFSSGLDGVSFTLPVDLLDAEAVAQFSRSVIESAYREGNCVVVGRGAQCVLAGKADVFHVFCYARWTDRLQRVRNRVKPKTDVGRLLRTTEEQRLAWVQQHYEKNRLDPHLYDLMINTRRGCEATAETILQAMSD